MEDDRHPFFPGGFSPSTPPRARSLSQARRMTEGGTPFAVRPGSSSHSLYEGPATHFAPSKGTVWTQQYAKSDSGDSTQYRNIFPSIAVTDLTRANKALFKGGSDSLSPTPDTWRGKPYAPAGMMGATLLRVNETTTAFGSTSMGSTTHDTGSGIMAEVLRQKWSGKSLGSKALDTTTLLETLTEKYPQLDTVEKMRGRGAEALVAQIADSRFEAAVAAGQRGRVKRLSAWQIGEYVQHKFAKHGLGQVPGGWADELRRRHGT